MLMFERQKPSNVIVMQNFTGLSAQNALSECSSELWLWMNSFCECVNATTCRNMAAKLKMNSFIIHLIGSMTLSSLHL